MTRKKFAQGKVALLACLVLTFSLMVGGCGTGGGSDSYDKPASTANAPLGDAATNVLVNAETLKSWIDGGLVNSDGTFDSKVVILDFGSYTMDPAQDPDRIAGACRVNNPDLASRRVEGVAEAFPIVATGEQMDAVIQRLGINENTTIVFTSSGAAYFPTRAYWSFRYWGFPQDKLKVLDGGNAAFAALYPELMTKDVPVPTASTYSVKDVSEATNDQLRLSIGEMLGLVSDLDPATDVILDARGPNWYSGAASSPGYVTGKVDYVVYDGHPAGGQYQSWSELYNADGTYKSKAEIEALLSAKGWSADKMTTVYCLSGYSATPLFFAIETIVGAPVRLYDGSWSQFGMYSDFAGGLGQLPAGSSWASDQYLALDEGYRYNVYHLGDQTVATPYVIETLQLDEDAVAAQPAPFTGDVPADNSDVVQSQVEAADEAYVGSDPATVIFSPALSPEVVINEATLQGWIDGGLLNAPLGSERVVILDVTDDLSYGRAHIPGAQLWNVSQHVEKRVEGPAPAVNMVLSGAAMDAMIQSHGIDENTTIVITSSKSATYFPSRAYFLFRYYGFPKDHIKVLNGYNGGWSGAMTTDAPTVTASTLSVQDIANIQLDTRVSLAELMDAVRDARGTAIDFRGDKSAAGSTPGVYSDVAGDYGVFEGTLQGGQFYVWKNFNVDYDGGDLTFKDAATIAAEMAAAGIDTTAFSNDGSYSNPVYSYCRTGYIASTGFFVLDAMLGLDVMVYDGSWSQWGKMSADATKGGELPEGSAWATDNATYMSVWNYNIDATRPKSIEALNPDENLLDLAPSDEEANQVENADAEYKADSDDSGDVGAPPSSGGGGPVIGC